ALDWSAVDLECRVLHVRRSWDADAGQYVEPKSNAGVRTVPMVERLALLLTDHRVLMNQSDGLLFPGRVAGKPLAHGPLTKRWRDRWDKAGLTPLGLHEARHTAASLFIAAGLNAKTVATYLGHANIAVTFDRYGHLFPGSEDEARGLLDTYLEGA
ncbi:MAG: site-specific integrase, partial [Solirubrobacteraceae bacterium]